MTSVTIDRLGMAGDGIGRHLGQAVYVPFSLPGETATGEICDGRMADASIDDPSPHRIRPVCPHFGACGGCALQHASDDFLAGWKSGSITRALAAQGLPAPIRAVHTSPPGSRRRATFTGRRTRKTVIVGFHGRASGVVSDFTECHLVRPEIVAARPALEALTRLGVSRKGELRLHVLHGRAGLDVQVSQARPADAPLLEHLAEIAAGHDLARLVWNDEVVAIRRPPSIDFGGVVVTPPPGAFLQATAEGERALVGAVTEAVGNAPAIVDMFCGCGTFSLPMAARARVHAVEGDAPMLTALDTGWRAGPGLKPLTCERRDLFRRPLLPGEIDRFNAAVIDPPRAGAEVQCHEIAASGLRRVAAVSCNPATFARDSRILCEAGFRIDWIEVIDQFRWSGHTELAAQLSR